MQSSSLKDTSEDTQKTKEGRVGRLEKYCSACKQRPGEYYCPHCNDAFCSVECARSAQHQDCLNAVDRNEEPSPADEKNRILRTLKKYGLAAPEGGGPLQFIGDEEDIAKSPIEPEDFDGEDDEEEAAEDSEEESEDDETSRRRKDLE